MAEDGVIDWIMRPSALLTSHLTTFISGSLEPHTLLSISPHFDMDHGGMNHGGMDHGGMGHGGMDMGHMCTMNVGISFHSL